MLSANNKSSNVLPTQQKRKWYELTKDQMLSADDKKH